jgi:methionine-rich copper-binding protein CopC
MNPRFFPLLVVASLWSGTAEAHASVERSIPRAGEVLSQAPAAVTLYFDSELEPAFSKLTVSDEQGQKVSVGDPVRANANRKSLAVSLTSVGRGAYHVQWDVVAHDGHRAKGGYVFTVK